MTDAIEVTATDLMTGRTETQTIKAGGYVLTVAHPAYLANADEHDGATYLIIRGRPETENK